MPLDRVMARSNPTIRRREFSLNKEYHGINLGIYRDREANRCDWDFKAGIHAARNLRAGARALPQRAFRTRSFYLYAAWRAPRKPGAA